jgi:uncharacterized membrane protein YebE (DUF533 family)
MDARELGAEWLFQKDWAFDGRPTAYDQEQYARALMICAAGDGTVSRKERDWVKGYFAAFGAGQELVDLLETYDGKDSLESVLAGSPAVAASSRALVHDAIRACSADGDLHPDELADIRKMNTLLGHEDDLVDRWREHYREEERLRQRRADLIWTDPASRPY